MAETAKKPNIFQRWARSFKDMRGEMKKVVWPTGKQIVNNSLVAIVVIVIFSIVVWGFDQIAAQAVNALISLGG